MTARSTAYQAAVRLAGEQHGALSARQLRSCRLDATRGPRPRSIRPPRSGRTDGLRRVRLAGHLVPPTEGRPARTRGSSAWVSHEAAAALLGLDRSTEAAVEFTVRREVRRRGKSGATVHTTAHVSPVDVIASVAFDAHRRRGQSSTSPLPARRPTGWLVPLTVRCACTCRRRSCSSSDSPNCVLWDAAACALSMPCCSTAAARRCSNGDSYALVRGAGLPRPETQRRICSNGRHVARVDFLYADLAMVVEVSGRLGHSNPIDRGRDAQRRNELQDLGYVVYEYTWGDITRRPTYVTTYTRVFAATRVFPAGRVGR